MKALLFSFMGYQDEILDIIEDYAPTLIRQSPEVMKICIDKIQGLRTQYRNKDREIKFHLHDQQAVLESYEESYSKPYSLTINKITTYIQTLQQHLASSDEIQSVNSQKSTFVTQELKRSIKYLNEIFTCTIKSVTNDDLKLHKKQLQLRMSEVRNLSEGFKELIELKTSAAVYDPIKKEYNTLYELSQIYEKDFNDELNLRELDKLDSFKNVQLNIKLPTFTGYDAEIDIYTFINDFKKLYSDHVPKSQNLTL